MAILFVVKKIASHVGGYCLDEVTPIPQLAVIPVGNEGLSIKVGGWKGIKTCKKHESPLADLDP